MVSLYRRIFSLALPLLFAVLWLTGCSAKKPIEQELKKTQAASKPIFPTQKISKSYGFAVNFSELPRWEDDDHTAALQTFKKTCSVNKASILLDRVCLKADIATNAKSFFEKNFTPYFLTTENGAHKGLLTGYYEPMLNGSRTKNMLFSYPIYKRPNDLITVDLSSIYPKLKQMRLRGRIKGNRLVPYESRNNVKLDNKDVICWVDDPIALFFLQVQGSGRVKLLDGEVIYVGYADQNGHPYRSIGKYMVKRGYVSASDVSLKSVYAWLRANPDKMDEVFNANPSYIFFQEKLKSASGSMGIPLTAKRSAAVDPSYIPLGFPFYVAVTHPVSREKLDRTLIAQDTGGAIKGHMRADFFWGFGDKAGEMAGAMKEEATFWLLVPNSFTPTLNRH